MASSSVSIIRTLLTGNTRTLRETIGIIPRIPVEINLWAAKNWWLERKDFLANAEKYVNEKSTPQIQELIRKYDPDILWFDTPQKLPLYLNIRILEAIRQADPQKQNRRKRTTSTFWL